MRVDVISIFPKMFLGPLDNSILKRAQNQGLVKIKVHDLRQWAKDKHKTVDDKPFGGGPGMVMRVEVIDQALKELKKKNSKVIMLTPQGKVFKQTMAKQLAKLDHLILICGHYEGVDERVRQ